MRTASAETACTGGRADVLMEGAGTITGQRQILMTQRIRISRHANGGRTGTSQESRRTGAVEENYIPYPTVRTL